MSLPVVLPCDRASSAPCCSGRDAQPRGARRASPSAAHPPAFSSRRARPASRSLAALHGRDAETPRPSQRRLVGCCASGRDSGVAQFRAGEAEPSFLSPLAALVGEDAPRERVGVLLLNLGGPETLDDVQPFLYNLFADPDILRLSPLLSPLQQPLAALISTLRAPKSKEGYAAIGGGSPLRRITDEQAVSLRVALESRGCSAHVYVAMRYWKPFTEDAVAQIKADRITRLVVLPLYPQFSISTSGSSLRLLEQLFREDEYLSVMKHTVIPSWYQRKGYVAAMANLVQGELERAFPDARAAQEARIFFSAHGVPLKYVTDAGDPYREEIEQSVQLIMRELRTRGISNEHTLAYQSRVGPVEWLKPYTDATIRELGGQGCKALLAVPISFVSEHIETLEEIDCEYRELAEECGIHGWGRVPALNCDQTFIGDLADAVLEALPFADATSPQGKGGSDGGLVPLGSVEDLLATYDGERLRLPPPIVVWRWGFTRSAEVWNGRLAMLAVVVLLCLEARSGTGILHTLGICPQMDPFGRPIVSGEGDAALAADTKQAALAGGGRGWAPAYGGRRQVGAVTRGGLLHNPFTKYGLPGVVLGFLLALFLASPAGKAPPGDADADARLTGTVKKKKQQWGGPAPPPGAELKLVLVVREDLGMSIGKTAAQCAHAAVGIVQKLTRSRGALLAAWEESGQTKITLKCKGIEELLELVTKAEAASLPVCVIQDAGRTEVEAGTTTVLAIGPGTIEAVNAVTGHLKLLR